MAEIEAQKSLPELLEKLARLNDSFQDDISLSPDKMREILRQRALKFKALEVEDDVGELIDVLEFTLRNQPFALSLQWIGEVCRIAEITEIPGTPVYVKGVVNLRRKIYSVIDLAVLLQLPAADSANAAADAARIGAESVTDHLLLTLIAEEMEFAVEIDRLIGVKSLSLQQLQTSLPTLSGAQADYFKGVTLDHLVVLDAEKLLHDEKLTG